MIIYNKSICLANHRCQKVWTFKRQNILKTKKKNKGIMVLNFFYPSQS